MILSHASPLWIFYRLSNGRSWRGRPFGPFFRISAIIAKHREHVQGGRRRQQGCHKSGYFDEQKQCFLHTFSFTDSVRPATGRASCIRTLRTLTPPPGVATNQRTENWLPKTEDCRLSKLSNYFKTVKGRKRPTRSVGRQDKRNRRQSEDSR